MSHRPSDQTSTSTAPSVPASVTVTGGQPPTDEFPSGEEIRQLRQKHYNATIIDRHDIHADLIRIKVRPDNGFASFLPGQYVALGLGNWEARLDGTQPELLSPKRYRKLVRRAYSISCPMLDWTRADASASNDAALVPVNSVDYLEFYVILVRENSSDKKPPALTPRLFRLGQGDRICIESKITGKYSLGDLLENPDRKDDCVLMIGTGTGEAPHCAMATELLHHKHRGRIIVATSVRNRRDLGYLAEHEWLMKRYPQYRYVPLTTREPENLDPSHAGYVGKQYLQDLYQSGRLAEMADHDLHPSHTHVFLCGNPAMIGYTPPGAPPLAKSGMLPPLREAGFFADDDKVGPGRIRFEKYW